MENGTSSILYIIISVIIILVGILGKKKKQQQIPGGSGNSETGGMNFFKKFGLREQGEEQERFIDVEEDQEITEIPVDKEIHRVSVTPAFIDQSDKKAEVAEKIFEEKTEEVDLYAISDEHDDELNEIKDEFDLKKAIIYSEIINKKYE